MKKAITFTTHFIATCWVLLLSTILVVVILDSIGLIEFDYYWRLWQLIWQGAILLLIFVVINTIWGAK